MGVSELEASLYVSFRCVSQFQVQKCFPLIHTKDALCGKIFRKESLHLNFSVYCGSTPFIRLPHHTLPGSGPLLDTVYRARSDRRDLVSPPPFFFLRHSLMYSTWVFKVICSPGLLCTFDPLASTVQDLRLWARITTPGLQGAGD